MRPVAVLRPAAPADASAVLELLAAAGLPTDGVPGLLGHFVVVESDGLIVGAAGLEPAGTAALLRSVVVAERCRGNGLASRLVERLLADAAARSHEAVWLLTETAAPFFGRLGFTIAPRQAAPAALQETAEFSRLCPATATAMVWRR